MIEKSPKLIWGLLSLLIYCVLIGLLLFYFNTRNDNQPKHYVKKNEHRIQVSFHSPKKKKEIISKPKKRDTKKKTKRRQKKKNIVKKQKQNNTKKKIIQEKIVKKLAKKKADNNNTKKPKKKKSLKKHTKTKVKKVNIVKNNKVKNKLKKDRTVKKTSDLFSKVNIAKHNKIEKKPINRHTKSEKKTSALDKIKRAEKSTRNRDSGVENAYFAKVQALLETWPAQSNFAGQKAMVRIYVKPTGQFDFKVKSKSNNIDFNLGLIDFLEQLKKLGLGSHRGGKTYEIEVEFTAKE